MIHGRSWRLAAWVLLLVALTGCGSDETKQPKLKETPGQPQLQPMMPGGMPPDGKSIRK